MNTAFIARKNKAGSLSGCWPFLLPGVTGRGCCLYHWDCPNRHGIAILCKSCMFDKACVERQPKPTWVVWGVNTYTASCRLTDNRTFVLPVCAA